VSQIKSNNRIFRVLCGALIVAILFSYVIGPSPVHAQTTFNLPVPGTMVSLSEAYSPAIITGLNIYPEDPLKFDFIIDVGDDHLEGEDLKTESQKLINYFMASLTVPEDEMWVNLSPYEKDRIMADGLSQTDMGRDMLAQDYLLKQLTASLIYPEEEIGETFWDRVYEKAQVRYGTTEIPTNTFNKVWIVPEKAVVYVHKNKVFVVENHLKVMLEEDYLALESNIDSDKHGLGNIEREDLDVISEDAKEILREVLIPEIEREINEGKNFAQLRQMFHSMILATWYKANLKESILGKVYVDKNKVEGIKLDDNNIKQKIYDQYLEAFEKGVYDYVREEYDPVNQEIIPRKYFSGGLMMHTQVSVENSDYSQAMLANGADRKYVTAKAEVAGINRSIQRFSRDIEKREGEYDSAERAGSEGNRRDQMRAYLEDQKRKSEEILAKYKGERQSEMYRWVEDHLTKKGHSEEERALVLDLLVTINGQDHSGVSYDMTVNAFVDVSLDADAEDLVNSAGIILRENGNVADSLFFDVLELVRVLSGQRARLHSFYTLLGAFSRSIEAYRNRPRDPAEGEAIVANFLRLNPGFLQHLQGLAGRNDTAMTALNSGVVSRLLLVVGGVIGVSILLGVMLFAPSEEADSENITEQAVLEDRNSKRPRASFESEDVDEDLNEMTVTREEAKDETGNDELSFEERMINYAENLRDILKDGTVSFKDIEVPFSFDDIVHRLQYDKDLLEKVMFIINDNGNNSEVLLRIGYDVSLMFDNQKLSMIAEKFKPEYGDFNKSPFFHDISMGVDEYIRKHIEFVNQQKRVGFSSDYEGVFKQGRTKEEIWNQRFAKEVLDVPLSNMSPATVLRIMSWDDRNISPARFVRIGEIGEYLRGMHEDNPSISNSVYAVLKEINFPKGVNIKDIDLKNIPRTGNSLTDAVTLRDYINSLPDKAKSSDGAMTSITKNFNIDAFDFAMKGTQQGKANAELATLIEEQLVVNGGKSQTKTRSIFDYDEKLERFKTGFSVHQFLSERTKDGGKVRWLDAPAGVGVALRIGKMMYDDQLDAIGVDLVNWNRETLTEEEIKKLERMIERAYEKTAMPKEFYPILLESFLQKSGIAFIQDDMGKVIIDGEADLITIIAGLFYSNDPLGTWVHLFNQLKPGGVITGNILLPKSKDLLKIYKRFEAELKSKLNINISVLDRNDIDAWEILIHAERRSAEKILLHTAATLVENFDLEDIATSGRKFQVKSVQYDLGDAPIASIESAPANDDAMMDSPKHGGIDFNAGNLDLEQTGGSINMQIDNAMLQDFDPNAIGEITPLIISITPVADFMLLLQ